MEKIEIVGNFENPKFWKMLISKISKINIFQHFGFSLFLLIFPMKILKTKNLKNSLKIFFRQDEKIVLVQIFSTVWIMSLDFKKTVQSTRGSSSMPRQWISGIIIKKAPPPC